MQNNYSITWLNEGKSGNTGWEFPKQNGIKSILYFETEKELNEYKNAVNYFKNKEDLNEEINFEHITSKVFYEIYKGNMMIMYKNKFFQNEKPVNLNKDEPYVVYTKSHVGIIYNNTYIDNNGIQCNKGWIENLVKEGYNYLITSSIPEGYFYSENSNNIKACNMQNLINAFLQTPTNPIERIISYGVTLKEGVQHMCVPTMMALIAHYKMEGKIDINKILSKDFNPEEEIIKYREQFPDQIKASTSIYDIRSLSEETKLLNHDAPKANILKIKSEENLNSSLKLECDMNPISKNTLKRSASLPNISLNL